MKEKNNKEQPNYLYLELPVSSEEQYRKYIDLLNEKELNENSDEEDLNIIITLI